MCCLVSALNNLEQFNFYICKIKDVFYNLYTSFILHINELNLQFLQEIKLVFQVVTGT